MKTFHRGRVGTLVHRLSLALEPWMEGRVASFTYTSICNVVTLGIILFLSSGIVTREYTAEMRQLHYFDYLCHYFLFVGYMIIIVCLIGYSIWALTQFIAYLCCLSHMRHWADMTASLLSMPLLLISTTAFTLESVLLWEMGVHLLDVSLIEVMGLKQVLLRQKELGAGIDPDWMPYINHGLVGITVLHLSIIFATSACAKKIGTDTVSRAASWLIAAVLTPAAILFALHFVIIRHRVAEFRTMLPLYFYSQVVVPVSVNAAVYKDVKDLPNLVGKGYPVSSADALVHAKSGMRGRSNEADSSYPSITNRKNVIIITQERWRYDDWESENDLTRAELNRMNCQTHNRTVASGHVTEMAVHALDWGTHPLVRSDFLKQRIPNFPLEMLRHNDYELASFTASTFWTFPNRFYHQIFEPNFYDARDDNGRLYNRMVQFLDERKTDKRNFFLHLHMHYSNHTRKAPHVEQDQWRVTVLNTLRSYGVLDDKSILFLSSDHGNMNNEHGEEGHGQPESSWWNEKMMFPLWVCAPGESNKNEMTKYRQSLSLVSQVDVAATWVDYLKPSPALKAELFSDGLSLLIPKDQPDVTAARFVYMFPRYFPDKNKVLAIANAKAKFWFRVEGLKADGKFAILPLKVTDWNDVDLCALEDLQYAYRTGAVGACEWMSNFTRGLGEFESSTVFYHFLKKAAVSKR